jgi:hypothetical protein
MHRVTGNEMVDAIAIVFFLILSCGFGWWMRNSELRTLRGEVKRLKNVEELCNRLWLRLEKRNEQLRLCDEQLRQHTDRQRQLAPPPRRPA